MNRERRSEATSKLKVCGNDRRSNCNWIGERKGKRVSQRERNGKGKQYNGAVNVGGPITANCVITCKSADERIPGIIPQSLNMIYLRIPAHGFASSK